MNTQAANAKAFNWNRVLRVTFRFAWAVTVLAFKLVLIALSFVIGMLTSGKDTDDECGSSSGCVDDENVMYKFGSESKYEVYKNHTRF